MNLADDAAFQAVGTPVGRRPPRVAPIAIPVRSALIHPTLLATRGHTHGLTSLAPASACGATLFLLMIVSGLVTRAASATEVDIGRQIFAQKCALCHATGQMGAFMLGRRLGVAKSDLTDRTDLPADYVRQIVRTGLNSMPYFTKVDLTDDQLNEVALYLSHSERKPHD